MNDFEAQALAEAIKNLEPTLRTRGEAPDWSRFRIQFQMGMFAEESSIPYAIDNSRQEKVNWTNVPDDSEPKREP